MKLRELMENSGLFDSVSMYRYAATIGTDVSGITDDSRKVKPGYLFVAIRGWEHDGHDYIGQAAEKGAVAVVCDKSSKLKVESSRFQKGPILIEVENTRRALGLLWAAWYDFPAKKLKVIGVTGTDGKTTTVNLIYRLLKSSGKRVGMISTINARIDEKEVDTGFHVTNPEPELLQKLLSQMVKDKLEYAVLEVTSHGIDQERITGVGFEGAVVTNVTHEHLDYHQTYEDYLQTKGRLFRDVNFSVLNRDDRSYEYLSRTAGGKIVTYGLKGSADVSARDINLTQDQSDFVLKIGEGSAPINLKLPGQYNIANALAAAAAGCQLGLSLLEIKRGLEIFAGLPGRFEEIDGGQPFRVIIDFAHTPNALEQVLRLSGKLKGESGKLVVVYGCAGERDREKRPMMGEISGKLADVSVLTAEDPRRENLDDIINSIAEGCFKAGAIEVKSDQRLAIGGQHIFVRVPNRREAISFALNSAQKGDIVLVTGKGHEKSMCFGTTEFPWSDSAVVREVLGKARGVRF